MRLDEISYSILQRLLTYAKFLSKFFNRTIVIDIECFTSQCDFNGCSWHKKLGSELVGIDFYTFCTSRRYRVAHQSRKILIDVN